MTGKFGKFFRNIINAAFFTGGSLRKPTTEAKDSWLDGLLSKVGIKINKKNALGVTTVFACIRLISESIASLPLYLYEKTPDGKRKATERVDYSVLHDFANPEMDSFQFWQCFVANACLYGKAYAEIVRNGAGQIAELWPIPTPFVQSQRNSETGELEYLVTTPKNENYLLKKSQIFNIVWFSDDGINSFKPLQLAQNAIGLSLATEEFGSNYFKNGANMGGIIEYPAKYSDEQYDRFRKSIREAYSGLSNSAKLLFLEESSKFTKVSNNPEESQALETRKFQVEEIARFFNVPPHMVMQLERATFSNIEQQSINFVVYTLRPWLVRIEKALKAQTLTRSEATRFFQRFNADALLRGDMKSRYESFAVARQNGWMNANDIRDIEDMNMIPDEEGGNEYLVNGNMISIKTAAQNKSGNGGQLK